MERIVGDIWRETFKDGKNHMMKQLCKDTIVDLGELDKYGCLPCNGCGQHPLVEYTKNGWSVKCSTKGCECMGATGGHKDMPLMIVVAAWNMGVVEHE